MKKYRIAILCEAFDLEAKAFMMAMSRYQSERVARAAVDGIDFTESFYSIGMAYNILYYGY